MKNLAIASTLWVSLSMLACETSRKGLGPGSLPDGGPARGGAGAGGAGGVTGTGGTMATGGATASGGRGGSGGAIATGGSMGNGGDMGTGGAVATGGRARSGGASGAGGTATGGAGGGRGGAGGASASGGAIGRGGATGGTSTTGTAAGGASGSGGASGAPKACTSSDGSGCDETTFCVDTRSDACLPDTMSGCTGLCAGRRHATPCAGAGQTPCPDGFACLPDPRTVLGTDPVSICVGSESGDCTIGDDCPTGFSCVASPGGRRCSPDRVVCEGTVVCKMMDPGPCPGGYARSTPDGCYGPCVPVELCGCSTDAECATAEASCDRKQARCYIPRSPEPRCQLPFDIGPCDAAMRVFAYVGGECQSATYGGCGGNDNRFSTLEECLVRCRGMPGERPCPEGRAERVICLACGAGGGCIQLAGVCAKLCAAPADCQASGFSCSGGYCEAAFCI